jgi:hypothetical protein
MRRLIERPQRFGTVGVEFEELMEQPLRELD